MYRFLPLVFFPLAALAFYDGDPTSGFIDSCHNISLVVKTDDRYNVPTLSATCKRRRSDDERKSELPLDRCLAYSPSKGLYGKSMGRAFENSYCYNCVPGPELGVMACACGTGDAPLIPHVVNLNQIIGTYNGSLACFNEEALAIEQEFRWSDNGQKNSSSTSAR